MEGLPAWLGWISTVLWSVRGKYSLPCFSLGRIVSSGSRGAVLLFLVTVLVTVHPQAAEQGQIDRAEFHHVSQHQVFLKDLREIMAALEPSHTRTCPIKRQSRVQKYSRVA